LRGFGVLGVPKPQNPTRLIKLIMKDEALNKHLLSGENFHSENKDSFKGLERAKSENSNLSQAEESEENKHVYNKNGLSFPPSLH